MDRTGKLILFVSILLLLSWGFIAEKLYPSRKTNQTSSTNAIPAQPAQQQAGNIVTNRGANLGDEVLMPAQNPTTANPVQLMNLPEAEIVTLETDYSKYHFTTHGGGIHSVELKEHLAYPGCREGEETEESSDLVRLNTRARMPFMTYATNSNWLGVDPFQIQKVSSNRVVASKELSYGLRVINEYEITEKYLIKVRSRLENTSDQPIQIPETKWVIGTAATSGSNEEPYYLKTQWFNGTKVNEVGDSYFSNRKLGCIPGTPRSEFSLKQSSIGWVSAESQFFAIVGIIPTNNFLSGIYSFPVQEVGYMPKTESEQQRTKTSKGFQTEGVFDARLLGPNEQFEHEWIVYCGPKEYKTLSRLSSRWDNKLDKVMGFGFLGIFSEALLLGMNCGSIP